MAFDLVCAGKVIGSIKRYRRGLVYAYGPNGLPFGTFATLDIAAKALWKAAP